MRYLLSSLLLVVSVGGAFADGADSAALSGGAGWVGAGLLGLVLSWLLLKYVPEKDRQLERLVGEHTQQILALIASRDMMIKDVADKGQKYVADLLAAANQADKDRRIDFREALSVVIVHCQREGTERDKMVASQLEQVGAAVVDMRRIMEDLREVYLDGIKKEKDAK